MQILFPLFKTSEKLWPLLFILLFSTKTSGAGGDFCVQPKFVKATTMELVSFLPHLTSQLAHTLPTRNIRIIKEEKGGKREKVSKVSLFNLSEMLSFYPLHDIP